MNKYEYIFNPGSCEREEFQPKTLLDRISRILGYTDCECGELERLRGELDNTQKCLANVIVFLVEEKGLREKSLAQVLGSSEEEIQ